MSAGPTHVSRRTFLQWTAFSMAGAAMAACAPTAAPASTDQTGSEAAAAPSADTPTVAFWLIGGQQWDDFYNLTIFPKFYEVHPEIKMETTILGSWTDLYNKLVTSAAGGVPPELARQKDFFTPDFAVRGIMQPLDDYAAASDHITTDAYLPLAWENSHWDGKLVAMPLHIFIHYLHMSNELFGGVGLMNEDGTPQVPDNWDQLKETAAAISRPDEGVYGTMLRSYGGEEDTVNFFHVMLAQAGGEFIDANYEKFLFNSEAGLDALTFQVGLIKEGLCLPPGASTEGVIENNKVGMWWHAANYWVAYLDNNPDFQWSTAINPERVTRGAVLRGNHLGMYAAAKAKDAAWKFVDFAMTPEIDYLYAQTANYFTARVENWSKPMYEGNYEGRQNVLYSTEIEQYMLPGNQPQPIFPGYQESTFKIGAQLMEAYLGTKTPQEALAQAEKEANEVLGQVRAQFGL
ncbi:MAG: extracellular solute-binding protein [Caldilineaceae bacterium]|nr:extracellular solute-binding protein [Caldilineaceae bacterium]